MARSSERRTTRGLGLALAALAAGCGGGDGAPKAGGGTGPLYVVSTGLESGDDFLGYLTTVPSLDAATTFTLDAALEIEPSWIFGKEGQPYVYGGSIFSPTLSRYRVGEDGVLVKDGSMSFAGLGLQSTYLAASAPIYSDEKSYFVDDVQDQMVIWNPKEMKIIGTIPFGNEAEGALPATPEGSVVVHDGLLLTSIQWLDWTVDSSQYGTHVRLIAVDPKTDAIVEVSDDARLTYAPPTALASDGTAYYSPASLIAAYALMPGHGSPSKALRVAPKARVFDPAFTLDLSALAGGRPAGAFTLLDDQTAIIRVWHADLADPVTTDNWMDVLWTQAAFKWWRWHVGDAQAVEIPNQSPGALDSAVLKIDGKSYVVRTNADSKTSTLDRIDTQGELHAGVTGPGQFIGTAVFRIR